MIRKLIKYIGKPKMLIQIIMTTKITNFIPDSIFLKLKYKLAIGNKLDLNNPKTFNEKIQWLKINDKKDIYTKMVDKYEVKKYVADIIGRKYIIKTIGVYDSFDQINFNELPNQFVIKCTHDSGGLIIVKDKSKLNIKETGAKINKALKKNYFYSCREWPYKNIIPRIIIEEYMEDETYKELIDYKIMCFNGEPKIIFTCSERYKKGLKVTFFDMNWNRLNFKRHYPTSNEKIEKPTNYAKMIELSKKLSKNIPFIRVDWYEINKKLYFGELTFYPGSGFEEFTPSEWDRKLGDMLELPKTNK